MRKDRIGRWMERRETNCMYDDLQRAGDGHMLAIPPVVQYPILEKT